MQGQRLTRSNSLNSKDNKPETVYKGRKLESPESEDKINKKPKSSAGKMDLEKTLNAMRHDLASINNRLESLPNLENKIDSISAEIAVYKKEVNDIKAQMKILDTKQSDWSNITKNNQAEINMAKQNKLDEQVMIIDVPIHITNENFIANINDWSKNLLESLGYRKLTLIKNKADGKRKASNTAFLHFWSFKDKFRFMEFIKKHQKQDDKYVPITCEQVFKLAEDDISKASVLHFQTPMTKINQGIFKEARTYKKNKKIESCWMMNGSIYIKANGNNKKGIRIDSIEQLNLTMAGIRAEISHKSPTAIMDITDSR
ncbi:hypothetical protein ACKWTF_007000 [Chironomus riparius]